MAQIWTHAFRWWVRDLPDRVALSVEGEEVTYAELDRWSNGVAGWLIEDLGVQPGSVVVIAGINSLEWCVAAVSAMKAGATIAPANTRYPPNELEFFIGNTSPLLVLADEGEIPKLRAVPEHGPSLNIMPLTAVNRMREGVHEPVSVDISPTAPAMLLYTSGTTGNPKGVVHTNEMLFQAMFQLLLIAPSPPEETCMLSTLPLFTSAGIYTGLGFVLARGGMMVVMREFEPRRTLDLIVRYRPSMLVGTPVVWEHLAKLLPEIETHDLSHLKFAACGGARLSDKVLDDFKRRGVFVRQMYGQTESGGVASIPHAQDAVAHPDRCGNGGIFTEIKILHPDGTPCRPGEKGDVYIRGPAVMREYWNNPKKTAESFQDGWLRSGDIGVKDEEGRLLLLDRISNLIVSGNHTISPNQVERALDSKAGITEIAIVGILDSKLGHKTAAIVYSESGKAHEAGILAEARQRLDEADIPHHIVLSELPLPRLASGKIDRQGLRNKYSKLLAEPFPRLMA